MSELTVNTDAYSRLKVPRAIAARLVDEWMDSCKSSSEESASHALLAEMGKVRRYIQLADKDVQERGARSKRDADSRQSSAKLDYRDYLMMAIGAVDTIESISNRRGESQGLTPNSNTSHHAENARKGILAIIDAVDGFEGPTLTQKERGWLEEYVRQLRERFPDQVKDVKVCSLDHDPELKTMVLVRNEDRETERNISSLGHTIDMSSFYIGPLIRVLTVDEWEKRKLTGVPIFFDAGEREGVSVL